MEQIQTVVDGVLRDFLSTGQNATHLRSLVESAVKSAVKIQVERDAKIIAEAIERVEREYQASRDGKRGFSMMVFQAVKSDLGLIREEIINEAENKDAPKERESPGQSL